MVQATRALMKNIAAAAYAITNFTNHLRLFVNTPTLGPLMVAAGFTEPTFTGYAAKALNAGAAWGVQLGQDGDWYVTPIVVPLFTCTADGGTDVVYGWFITEDAGSTVIAAEYFDTPVPMSLSGSQLTALVGLNFAAKVNRPAFAVGA